MLSLTWEMLEGEKERSLRGPRERRMGIINSYCSHHIEVVFYSCPTCRLTREQHFGSSALYKAKIETKFSTG